MRFGGEAGAADGAVYVANAHAIGVRAPDALYRFMRGFAKPVIAAHHLFGESAEPDDARRAWEAADVAGQMRALKQQPGRSIGMSGSSSLVSWLLRQGLLDRLDLLVFPVVLGRGKRLLSEPGEPVPLTLTGSQAFSTGVVHLTYEPAS